MNVSAVAAAAVAAASVAVAAAAAAAVGLSAEWKWTCSEGMGREAVTWCTLAGLLQFSFSHDSAWVVVVGWVMLTHEKKLFSLGLDKRYDPLDPDKVVFNYSHISLSSKLKFLLAKGLKYALPPSKINFAHYFLSFEKLLRALNKRSVNKLPEILQHVKSAIKNVAFSSYYSYGQHNFTSGLTKDDLLLLNDFSKNTDIIVTKPDRGQGVVILNKNEYIDKMESILGDETKFIKIDDDCTSLNIKREDQLNNMLRKLKDSQSIDKDTYSRLFTSGKPGILYGLPKVHKTGWPLRSILSAIGTLNYHISKYFVPILKTLTINEFTIHDNFSFVKTILNIPDADSYIMTSFDVTSFFTNVPLVETITIITDSLFNHSTHKNGLNKLQFRKLLEIATKDKRFIQVQKFLQYMNSQHKNIKFTCELESDGKLPFLDVSISRDNNSFSTATYRKPTYTGLTTKFDSFIPVKEPVQLAAKDRIYINLPYIGPMSYTIRRKLVNLINVHYSTVHLRIIFTSTNTIGHYFKFKDKSTNLLCSSVVYKFTCSSCNAAYIGKTSRNLSIRADEHEGISYRTGRPLGKPMVSPVREHCQQNNHNLSNDLKVIDSSPFASDLYILECLWIWKGRPKLNEYLGFTDLELCR
ncbi:uncharacterized protein [Penaeus vannamei]|uniref:uncharacterized protein n=1 Tax=Penaeus vannamei TaxID=6689 RepID=UPI00387F4079